MKKNYLFLLFICASSLTIFVGAQPMFTSVKKLGGTQGDSARMMEIDVTGNTYTVGVFRTTADLDPGSGVFNITSAGNGDGFITRSDASGNFVWAKSFGGAGYDIVSSVALNGTNNCYITGQFSGTVDFDPNAGVLNLTSAGLQDIFICKLDNAGNLLWAKQLGGSTNDAGLSIVIDADGNVVVAGHFSGTTDFDPGAGVTQLTSLGVNDIFICTLGTDGSFLSTKQIGGTADDKLNAFVKDASGSFYLTGNFSSAVDFDPGAGTFVLTPPSNYVFFCRLDASQGFVWAKMIGNNSGPQCYSMAIDASGNVYSIGNFRSNMDFDPGAGSTTLTATGDGTVSDIFFLKLNPSGDFVWVKSIGSGPTNETPSYIAVDPLGDLYATGRFGNTGGQAVDFNPGTAVTTLTTIGNSDAFYMKLTNAGDFLWAYNIGVSSAVANGSFIKIRGIQLFILGEFTSAFTAVDFDPGPGVSGLFSNGDRDAFILQLAQPGPLPVTLMDFSARWLNENKAELSWKTSSEQNTDKFIIQRSTDSRNFSEIGTTMATGNSSAIQTYSFVDDLAAGNTGQKFFYRLQTVDKDGKFGRSGIVQLNRNGSGQTLFTCLPNPSQSILHLNFFQPGSFVIYDAAGRLVRRQAVQEASIQTLNISQFSKGVYTVVVYGGAGTTEMKRFVKQ